MTDTTPPAPPGRAYEVLTPGEKFGDYQVLRCVSYDLLGSLYRVRKPRAKEEKTVFVMPPIIQATAEFKTRFSQLAPKLCQLDHVNVLSFDEAMVVKDRFTFLGGAFEGENLADYLHGYVNKQIKERKADSEPRELVSDLQMGLPPEEVTSILHQTLSGLSFLFNNKILHLNLNPTNILRGSDGKIRVAGFGLMNLIGQERFEEIVSAGIPPIALGGRAIRINTVDILSPEARQGKPSDARSDVYALGITAYWLLTGRKPTADYTPPSEIVEDLDQKWDIFIANCLDREPDKRYQNVAKAQADFEDFAHIKPLRSATSKAAIGTTETTTIFRHLDFIPVPKQVQARGAKFAGAFRLGVVGAIVLIVGALVFSAINMMLVDDSTNGQIAIKTPEGQTPRLAIALSPDNASVRIKTTDLNFIVREGKLDLNILPGSYRLEFNSPGYITQSQLVLVESEPQSLSIKLKPAMTETIFTAEPGTKLTAKAMGSDETVEIGVTGADGAITSAGKLTAGDYMIIAEKEGYAKTESGPYTLSAREANAFAIPLEAILGVLRVRSDPTGADIYFQGNKIGVTNATLEDLPVEEEFTITLKKEGYRDKTLAVTVASDTRTILDFETLTPLSGEIAPVINFGGKPATPEQLAGVTVAGTSTNPKHGVEQFTANASSIADGQFKITGVNEGDIEMTVSHPDYLDQSLKFTLANAQRAKVIFNLPPKPAIVTLAPSPAGEEWEFTLNGKKVNLPELKASLAPGVKSVIGINNKNYFPVTKAFTPKPNEQISWAPKLEAIPGPEKGKPYEVPFLGIDLVWLQPGSFTMGSPPTEPSRLPEEGPVTEVRLTQGFWMGAHEVTQQQYEQLIGFNPARNAGEGKPVEYVSWREANAFCKKLTELEKASDRLPAGYEYRLPTEAEWEYAARAGSSEPFHWGNTADHTNANFQGKYPRDFESSELGGADHYGPVKVGSYPANAWGIYDVHGNVREWTIDNYNSRLPGDVVTDFVRREETDRRPTRGGGWEDYAIRSRAATREGLSETFRGANVGFRIVLAPVVPE